MYYRQQPGTFFPTPGFPGQQGNISFRLERLERQMNRLEREMSRLDRRVERIERRLGLGIGRDDILY